MSLKFPALVLGFIGGNNSSSPYVEPTLDLEKGSQDDTGTNAIVASSMSNTSENKVVQDRRQDYAEIHSPDDGDGEDCINEELEDNGDEDSSQNRTDAWQRQSNRRKQKPPQPTRFARIRQFLFPSVRSSLTSVHIHNFRVLPILSGVAIPFSILLSIPGLTEHWYIVTEDNQIIFTRPNGALLDAGMAISMGCAVVANAAIIVRFLEKKVRTMTLIAIAALSIHDIISITSVTIFGVQHRFSDGFTYGQSFWFTVCSTIVSSFTNITLIIDYIRTPNFAISGSGLTHAQRSLVTILILLFTWIALGAAVNSVLMNLSFINGLYFTVVTVETIGFGDIVPINTASRIFVAIHSTVGIVNLALAVGLCRETVIESFEHAYRIRIKGAMERRRERREKRARARASHKELKAKEATERAKRDGEKAPSRRRIIRIMHNPRAKDEKPDNDGKVLYRTSSNASSLSVDSVFTEGLQKDFAVKLVVAWTLFVTFWLLGAAIFMHTEGWPFGIALWFCFESFSTIGYGERTPTSPAGRSVFIVWAMLGVGTMTILVSVLSEAYSSRYERAFAEHHHDDDILPSRPGSPCNDPTPDDDTPADHPPGDSDPLLMNSSGFNNVSEATASRVGRLKRRLRRSNSCPVI